MRVQGLGVLLCTLFVLVCACSLSPQDPYVITVHKIQQHKDAVEIPLATATRLEKSANSWWPTKVPPSRDGFVGNMACAECHARQVATQAATPMAHASLPASDSKVLREHPLLTGLKGKFSHNVSQTAEGPTLSVSEGGATLTRKILWAFGAGNKGQTFVYSNDGLFYESEMSFYAALDGLDVTTGHESHKPADPADALGMKLDLAGAQKCFGCHTTLATTVSKGLNPGEAKPGISCEACHGPGGAHAQLMTQLQGESPSGDLRVFNPRSLSPIAAVDFCGACHRTWADVYELDEHGPVNARFQPYRLENSKCWGDGDARLTCVACHDPHQPLVHESTAYDTKCLACHANVSSGKKVTARAARSCPVAKSNCVSCHMPKITVPVMHSEFTDHRIRVVRKGERYPD